MKMNLEELLIQSRDMPWRAKSLKGVHEKIRPRLRRVEQRADCLAREIAAAGRDPLLPASCGEKVARGAADECFAFARG